MGCPDAQQVIEDVLGVANRYSPVGEKVVGSLRGPRGHRARDRPDDAAQGERVARRDQRPRRPRGLDDHRDRRSAAMIRLRTGNDHLAGRRPGGVSERIAPVATISR